MAIKNVDNWLNVLLRDSNTTLYELCNKIDIPLANLYKVLERDVPLDNCAYSNVCSVLNFFDKQNKGEQKKINKFLKEYEQKNDGAHWIDYLCHSHNKSKYFVSTETGINSGTLFYMIKRNVPLEKSTYGNVKSILKAFNII